MPRHQFTLKTLLVWAVLLPATIGAIVSSVRWGETEGHPLLMLAGALFGVCVGSYKSSSHAVLGAFFGAILAWPAFVVGLIVLVLCGLVEVD